MLADVPLGTEIPASDIDRAKRFYRDILGLKLLRDEGTSLRFESGGQLFSLYSTPSGGQAAHTLAAWKVDDLDAEMAELRRRGIVFEEYDLPGMVNGAVVVGAVRAAWFKDSEGNILSVVEDA